VYDRGLQMLLLSRASSITPSMSLPRADAHHIWEDMRGACLGGGGGRRRGGLGGVGQGDRGGGDGLRGGGLQDEPHVNSRQKPALVTLQWLTFQIIPLAGTQRCVNHTTRVIFVLVL
jgi:hypothetical protein